MQVVPIWNYLIYPTNIMCVKQAAFDKLSDTVSEIKDTLNQVQNTGEHTLKQATKTNSRVDALETNVNEINRGRASRLQDCPNRNDLIALNRFMTESKAVKRESRFWFAGIALLIAGEYIVRILFNA